MVKQKMLPGVLSQTIAITRIYGSGWQKEVMSALTSESLQLASSFLAKIPARANAAQKADVKRAVLEEQCALQSFRLGKTAYRAARDGEKEMMAISVMTMDYAAKDQVIKDIAKLAAVQGQIQAQSLKVIGNCYESQETLWHSLGRSRSPSS